MNIKVNGKEYNLEYTFDAAHDKKCVDVCWSHFSGANMIKGIALDQVEGGAVEKTMTMDRLIGAMSDIPGTTLYLLYAGLLENHSDEITCEADAKAWYKQFCKENPDDEKAMDSNMLLAIKEQMEKDGFFKRIGLQEFLDQSQTEQKAKKQPKVPQDHKTKAKTKATVNP